MFLRNVKILLNLNVSKNTKYNYFFEDYNHKDTFHTFNKKTTVKIRYKYNYGIYR